MYIEDLRTPHPSLAPETDREAFFVAAGLGASPDCGAAADSYDAVADEAVARIQTAIQQSLRYPQGDFAGMGREGLTTFDSLRSHQVTNCLGYTAVGSESLTMAGIDHYIGYANGHWLLLRPTHGGRRLRTEDMLTPRLSQDITDSLLRSTPQGLIADAEDPANGRGVAMLDSLGLSAKAGHSVEELESRHPWLGTGRSTQTGIGAREIEDRRYARDHTLILTAYTPALGQAVLHWYADFAAAVQRRDTASAVSTLSAMRGLYPEIDARAPHQEVRQLVADLCGERAFEHALAVVDAYCANFAPSQDARLKGLEGDLLREISKASADPDIAQRCMDAYHEAIERTERTRCVSYSTSMYAGKIAVVSAGLGSGETP